MNSVLCAQPAWLPKRSCSAASTATISGFVSVLPAQRWETLLNTVCWCHADPGGSRVRQSYRQPLTLSSQSARLCQRAHIDSLWHCPPPERNPASNLFGPAGLSRGRELRHLSGGACSIWRPAARHGCPPGWPRACQARTGTRTPPPGHARSALQSHLLNLREQSMSGSVMMSGALGVLELYSF